MVKGERRSPAADKTGNLVLVANPDAGRRRARQAGRLPDPASLRRVLGGGGCGEPARPGRPSPAGGAFLRALVDFGLVLGRFADAPTLPWGCRPPVHLIGEDMIRTKTGDPATNSHMEPQAHRVRCDVGAGTGIRMTQFNPTTDLRQLQAVIARSPIVFAEPRPARDFADWCERRNADLDHVILDWLRSQAALRKRARLS